MVVWYISSYICSSNILIYIVSASKQKHILIIGVTTLLLLFFKTNRTVYAQQAAVVDSVNIAFLPALSYNSDFGLVGGGILNFVHYKRDYSPFYKHASLNGLISTRGLASVSLLFDKPNLYNSPLRLTGELFIDRILEDAYFGIGNYDEISKDNRRSGVYYFKSFSVGGNINFRYPVNTIYLNNLEFITSLLFEYSTPWDNKMDKLIMNERPLGITGNTTVQIGTGFILESRDNEFRPQTGSYLKILANFGHHWVNNNKFSTGFNADYRQYLSFHLIRDITFANRLYFENTASDIAFWQLASLGGKNTLRGYPIRRFIDNNALVLNSELRTWLFKIDALKSEFGGNLFFDVGKTFPNNSSLKEIVNDLKYSFGFSGTAAFLNPDFILRIDVGFSDESIGIYFTTGYMF